MSDPAVCNKHTVHSAADRFFTAVDLRDHTARNDPLAHERFDVRNIDLFNQARLVVLVVQKPLDVGHENEALRLERARNARRRAVRIDVIDIALVIEPHGGDDGHIVLFETVGNELRIYTDDLAHKAELFVLLFAEEHSAVHSRKPHRFRAQISEHVHKRFIHFPRKYHSDDFRRLLVGITKPVDKFRLNAHARERLRNFGTAPVD